MNDEEYHLRSLRCCAVRQALGGLAATEGNLFYRSIAGLRELGMPWDELVEKGLKAMDLSPETERT